MAEIKKDSLTKQPEPQAESLKTQETPLKVPEQKQARPRPIDSANVNIQTHYNISKMNVIFFFSAFALLISTVAMFVDDYVREWKGYQRTWHQIVEERAKQELEVTEADFKASGDLAQFQRS
jgi:hypothetical protein